MKFDKGIENFKSKIPPDEGNGFKIVKIQVYKFLKCMKTYSQCKNISIVESLKCGSLMISTQGIFEKMIL